MSGALQSYPDAQGEGQGHQPWARSVGIIKEQCCGGHQWSLADDRVILNDEDRGQGPQGRCRPCLFFRCLVPPSSPHRRLNTPIQPVRLMGENLTTVNCKRLGPLLPVEHISENMLQAQPRRTPFLTWLIDLHMQSSSLDIPTTARESQECTGHHGTGLRPKSASKYPIQQFDERVATAECTVKQSETDEPAHPNAEQRRPCNFINIAELLITTPGKSTGAQLQEKIKQAGQWPSSGSNSKEKPARTLKNPTKAKLPRRKHESKERVATTGRIVIHFHQEQGSRFKLPTPRPSGQGADVPIKRRCN